jgi:hypothetical protein
VPKHGLRPRGHEDSRSEYHDPLGSLGHRHGPPVHPVKGLGESLLGPTPAPDPIVPQFDPPFPWTKECRRRCDTTQSPPELDPISALLPVIIIVRMTKK